MSRRDDEAEAAAAGDDARARLTRAIESAGPGRLLGKGHSVGDFLEAHEWRLLERRPGYLRLDVHLPDHVRNARGVLFGGFTATYVDLVAVHTVRAGEPRGARRWLATVNLRVDYLEPVSGPRFEIESEVVNQRGRVSLVQTRFRDAAGRLLVFAMTTIREAARSDGE